MEPETKIKIVKILYVVIVMPLNVMLMIKFQSLIHLIGLLISFGFVTLWLWQWHRRLVYRAEFLHLASKMPTLEFASKERKEAHKRLLELVKPNIIQVHEIAAAFDEMNKREIHYLTDEQRKIINNLRAGKEIFYSSENLDIQFLVKTGWLITTENEGEYIVNVGRIDR